VAQRGICRDFWDLHELLKGGLTLERALSDYANRYDAARTELYHVLRALTYFDDAERSSTFPAGLTPRHWQEIRVWFEERAAAPLRKLAAKTGGGRKRKRRP
jgi:hypothetical protein